MGSRKWMIEFSYECDFMLHNAWLDIPCVFLCFIEMISDKHTWRRLIQFTYGRELVVHWAGLFLVLSFSLQHSDSCMIFSHQPFFDFCWFLVDELVFIRDATQVPSWLSSGVAESYSSLIISDTPAVLIVKEKNLIGTCIEASSSTTLGCCLVTMVAALRDTADGPPLISDICWYEDACHDVVAFVILVLTVDVRFGLFKDDESRHILAKTRRVVSYFSSAS